MTIVDVEKSWSRSGGDNTSSDGRTYRLRMFEGWQVTHSADATDLEIMAAPGIAMRDKHATTYTFCTRVNLPQRLGPIYSIVLIEYDGEIGPGGVTDSPLNKKPEYTWSSETSTELIDEDWDGKPIVTVNNEDIHGVTMEVSDQALTITRNFADFSPWLTHQYLHSTNSDNFANFPPGVAKFQGYTATLEYAPQFSYWRVQARVKFRWPFRVAPAFSWYARVRHEGYMVKETDGTLDDQGNPIYRIVNAIDKNQSPSMKPVLLDSFGRQQEDSTQAYWLLWKRYQSLPYQALGLL